MALPLARTTLLGKTEHPHEQEALDFLRAKLPDSDPYHLWALFELVQRSTGRRFECDALVLGPHALYLVEIKGYSGRIEGDKVDWQWTPPHGRRRAITPPIGLNNHKAKVLKSELERHWHGDRREVPWVQSLVFLSAEDLSLDLRDGGELGVVTRKTLENALVRHDFPGAGDHVPRRYDRRTLENLRRALDKIGIRKRETQRHAGSFVLEELIRSEDDAPYQDWIAAHRDLGPQRRALARSYNVPAQTDPEKRERLVRAAKREADAYMSAGGAQSILTFVDFDETAEVGPTLLLEYFEGGLPLDRFLHRETLDFESRYELLEEIGHALSYAHRQEVIHGGLSPESVLVRRGEGDRLEIRLCNFQLGSAREATATSHYTSLAGKNEHLYLAPERLLGQPPTHETDVYGLGALAFLLFTGKPPAATLKEVHEQIRVHGCLDVDLVSDTVGAEIRELIRRATSYISDERHGSVEEFLDHLLDACTTPSHAGVPAAATKTFVDPLEAQRGDLLNEHLVFEGYLGEGASSRVFKVRDLRDGGFFALKVALSADHDARLAEEGAVLSKLEHPRIARCRDVYELSARTALLLDLAGDETLFDHLRREGAVGLDFGQRFGEDLLEVLAYLETPVVDVVHKDIKPANIGVGSVDKTRKRLTLFDFSLASAPRDRVEMGTPAYRDPSLERRGGWDAAADHWAAAITLHEMLTGVRPRLELTSSGARVVLDGERFDPIARDALLDFFERALAPDVTARFASAEQMLDAWRKAFAATDHPSLHPAAPASMPVEQLTPDTPLARLGRLSARALNALDRAGILTVGELAAAPENRIRLIRGAGRKVAEEINALRRELESLENASPFRPGYAGERREIDALGLPSDAVARLLDAGLFTTAEAASASSTSLARLLGPHLDALAAILDDLHREALEARKDRLVHTAKVVLESKRKGIRYVRAFFGVDDPFAGRDDVRCEEVAKWGGVTTANVYIAVSKERDRWLDLDEMLDLVLELRELVTEPVPLRDLAERLVTHWGGDLETQTALAMGLVRAALECEKADSEGLRYVRLGEDRIWVVPRAGMVEPLVALMKAADALASRDTLPSPSEIQVAIRDAVRGSPLESVEIPTLLRLMTGASSRAALSPRGELYPKHMDPVRSLRLCAPLLRSGQSAADIHQLVKARFPHAAEPPPRPALDALLQEIRDLRFNEAKNVYEAPGEDAEPARSTRYSTATQSAHHLEPSVLAPASRPRVSRREASIRDFEENLAVAKERGGVRVLRTTLDRAPVDAKKVARLLGAASPIYLDRELFRAMQEVAEARRIRLDVVHDTDTAGPGSPAWNNLVKLMHESARRVADSLLGEPGPKVLTHLGPVARYGLDDLVETLVKKARESERHGVIFIVPGPDGESSAALTPSYALPGVMQGEVHPIPKHWPSQA